MSEQNLDGAQVGAGLQQVGGEAVAQGVGGDVLGDPRVAGRLPADLPDHGGRD